jgi:hypothetical protein
MGEIEPQRRKERKEEKRELKHRERRKSIFRGKEGRDF